MVIHYTQILPGVYQYHYPTFTDLPQQLCIHFITADGQQAFVSYPNRSRKKAAQLVSLSWFRSVILEKMEAESRLMLFLEITLINWLSKPAEPLFRNEQLKNVCEYLTANTLLTSQAN